MKIIENYPYQPFGFELTQRLEDAKRTGKCWDFLAFGAKKTPDTGPVIRFCGGTPATAITVCAPSMQFDVYGDCEVVIGEWMNRKNCPNAFALPFVSKVTRFVQENLPVLLLVYLGHLNAADAMDYFCGEERWETLLSAIHGLPEEDFLRLQYSQTPYELHLAAFQLGLYQHWCRDLSEETFEKVVCPRLKTAGYSPFEVDWYEDDWILLSYNGKAGRIAIPEDIICIGESAFEGHEEIQRVRFSTACCCIETRAFAGCIRLQQALLPDSCKQIDTEAFFRCTALTDLLLPEGISIGDDAFQNCTSLGEVNFPDNIQEIGVDAFLGCENLVIRCSENSYAHRYAQENHIPFTFRPSSVAQKDATKITHHV